MKACLDEVGIPSRGRRQTSLTLKVFPTPFPSHLPARGHGRRTDEAQALYPYLDIYLDTRSPDETQLERQETDENLDGGCRTASCEGVSLNHVNHNM